MQEGRHSLAARHFYRVFELDSTRTDALRALAEALVADGTFAKALPIYEMIAEIAPSDHTSRFNYAVVLSRLGYYGRAEKLYQSLLGENPAYLKARYNLAVLYQDQGRLEEAIAGWKLVLASADKLPSAHRALGQVYLDIRDLPAAMEQYAKVAKLCPNDAEAWTELARVARLAGSLGVAAAAAQRAVGLSPNDADLWADLGNVKFQMHQHTGDGRFLDEAKAAWEQGLRIDESRKDLRESLDRCSLATTGDENTSQDFPASTPFGSVSNDASAQSEKVQE